MMGSHFSFDSCSEFGESDSEEFESHSGSHLSDTLDHLSGQSSTQMTVSWLAEQSFFTNDDLTSCNSHFLFVNNAEMMDPDSPATSSSYESNSPRTPVTSIAPRTAQHVYYHIPDIVSTTVDSSPDFQTPPEIMIDQPPPYLPKEKNSFLSLIGLARRNSTSASKPESISAAPVKPKLCMRRPSTSVAFKLLSHLRPSA